MIKLFISLFILSLMPFASTCEGTIPASPIKRIVFFGNSITAHDPDRSIGWFWFHGMAATQADLDHPHRLQLLLTARQGFIPEMEIVSADIPRFPNPDDIDGRTLDMDTTVEAFDPDTIVIQMGDKTALDAPYEDWLSAYTKILSWSPHATKRIVVGLWEVEKPSDPREGYVRRAALELGMTYVKINDLHTSATEANEFAHGGVRWHPNNLGHRLIAERVLEALLLESRFLPLIHGQ